ncbi:protein PAL OF QUIRKY-like [Actinidia eriantha]|uniref:protein PAL OF QUIRKY-like n=1 Tax=Actinidia eriantha TaxID=165200 RepID=UPI002587AEC2|nr:protein PAL OF QUIRKY-like [Actinidia eriantha]
MDAAPISAAAEPDPVDPATSKLRLMCSYGGSIVPRPHDKSLCYAGGDTRIVAVDRRTTAASLSSLTSHLSRTLYNNRPFLLKYQLPDEDLDALVSVATDEDLQNMIDEQDRIVNSPRPSRIRLFLFPSKAESVGSALIDSKAESWFCDALKSTKIMQRGQSADSGLVNGLMGLDSDSCVEAQAESLSNEVKHGLDLGSVPESMVLETSSSFGSTSSSISMLNFPPIAAHGDDGVVNLQEKKVKVLTPGSIERASSSAVEAASFAGDLASGIQMPKNIHLHTHQVPLQSDQIQHQQHMSYIQAGAHYIPQYSTGQFPISSYHPMYYSPMHQQTHNPYQPNPPYPVYLLPVRPPQSYNTSMQYNLLDTATTALSRPQMHPSTTTVTPPVPYKEVLAAAPLPELATKVYRTVAGPTPLIEVPSDQNQPPLVDLSEVHHPSQSVATGSIAAANYDNEYEDDLAYTQIYKTQPSLPALLSQYQTMTGAGLVLSEASKLPHADSVKRHIGTSQPQ